MVVTMILSVVVLCVEEGAKTSTLLVYKLRYLSTAPWRRVVGLGRWRDNLSRFGMCMLVCTRACVRSRKS